jgi:ubiquinone/menaquinone biosynthesis C-methylase UbiE/uncharacterized protein YbaR (Trm112 family)
MTLSSPNYCCPACLVALVRVADGYECPTGGHRFPIIEGIPVLLLPDHDESKLRQASWFDEEPDDEFEISRPHGTPALYRWYYDKKLDWALSQLTPWVAGRLVLTVCGGSGMDAEYLARRGARVISSDISLEAAKRARERARRYHLDITPIVADVERLPFQDRSIEFVLVHDGLHHLSRPLAGLTEMARVARQAVSLTEPAKATATGFAVRFGIALEVEDAGNRVERLNKADVVDTLRELGLEVVSSRRYAMYYKHEPGRVISALSREPFLSATKGSVLSFNALLGGMGNRLAVQAVQHEGASIKERVRAFWDETPCGTRHVQSLPGTPEYFATLDSDRERLEPFIEQFARFDEHEGDRVLEVGIGPGTDLVRFARAGAALTGVDLTESGVRLARRRLELEGFDGTVLQADAEDLPLPSDSFDFVYSWGVIHHTPDPAAAAREIARVTRPGGRVCVMLYHRHSLVALQSWIVNALLRGAPFQSFASVIGNHHESIGTRAYTIAEARDLFSGLEDVHVTPVVTRYDIRLTRGRFAPDLVLRRVPKGLGWFLVVEGQKAQRTRSAGAPSPAEPHVGAVA